MHVLENPVQNYAWGSAEAIPALLGRTATGTPVAEVWMGAHPMAPSMVCIGERRVSLLDHIEAAPERHLGVGVVDRFGVRLPFLFKLLAAAKPLSLQAHPTLAQARAGFAREEALGIARNAAERNYKDANHKPEVICALTEFEALCGFRPAVDSVALLGELGLSEASRRLEAGGLARFFKEVMEAPAGERAAVATRVVAACAQRPPARFSAECAWAVRLGAQYPGDIGVLGALLLNLVVLKPGEALFLPAGNLHAYLSGVGVEVMSSSDNVLRGGLTSKHIDVAELLTVLDFRDEVPSVMVPEGAPEAVYSTPCEDFRLSRIGVTTSLSLERLGPDVLWVSEGRLRISTAAERMDLSRGQSVFVGASEGAIALEGDGTVFRVTTPK